MTATRTSAKQFSKSMREGIERVRFMLTQDFHWPVVTKYSRNAHTGEPLVEFTVDAIPEGSIAEPGPIGVLSRQTTPYGVRYDVADAYGATVLDGLTSAQALRLSRRLIGLEGPGFFDGDGVRIFATEAERAAHGLGHDEDDKADGFSGQMREVFDNIRRLVSYEIDWPVSVVYGQGDDGPTEQWAAFALNLAEEECPSISICIGRRIREGFAAVLGTDPRTVLRGVTQEDDLLTDRELHAFIHATIVAQFHALTSKRRRPGDDDALIAMALGAPMQ